MDSARANLASTFVNAFVNAGFGQDKLVTAASEDEKVGAGARVESWVGQPGGAGLETAAAAAAVAAAAAAAAGRPACRVTKVFRFLSTLLPLMIDWCRCTGVQEQGPRHSDISPFFLASHFVPLINSLCFVSFSLPLQVHWIFKNKDHGKMSATASLGTVLLWDVEGGLPQIDRFLYSTDNQASEHIPHSYLGSEGRGGTGPWDVEWGPPLEWAAQALLAVARRLPIQQQWQPCSGPTSRLPGGRSPAKPTNRWWRARCWRWALSTAACWMRSTLPWRSYRVRSYDPTLL